MSKEIEKDFTQQEIAPCAEHSEVSNVEECIAAPQAEPVEEKTADGSSGKSIFLDRISRFGRKNFSAKEIAEMGIFVALGLVVNAASFSTATIFGRISFVYFFCYMAGIIFGPYKGFFVAVSADLIPALLFPQGPWVPHITVGCGLMAAITGFAFRYLKFKPPVKIIISAVAAFFICTLGLNSWGEAWILFDIFPYALAKTTGASLGIKSKYLMVALSKAITQPVWIALNILITVAIYYRLKNYIAKRQPVNEMKADKERNCV